MVDKKFEASIKICLKPIKAPNFLLLDKNVQFDNEFTDKVSLKMVDANVLSNMCDQFRDEMFKKAGKEQPPLHSEKVWRLQEIMHVVGETLKQFGMSDETAGKFLSDLRKNL